MIDGAGGARPAGETTVMVGDDRTVGVLRVEPGKVRGKKIGGAPHLAIPVRVAMRNHPSGLTLALVHLNAGLTMATGNTTMWRSLPLDLIEGMPFRSVPTGAPSELVSLQFALGPAGISMIERARQECLGSRRNSEAAPFRLALQFSGRVAVLITRGDPSAGSAMPNDPFAFELGPHSELSMFWKTSIAPTTFDVDNDAWVSGVIPAFKSMLHRGR